MSEGGLRAQPCYQAFLCCFKVISPLTNHILVSKTVTEFKDIVHIFLGIVGEPHYLLKLFHILRGIIKFWGPLMRFRQKQAFPEHYLHSP